MDLALPIGRPSPCDLAVTLDVTLMRARDVTLAPAFALGWALRQGNEVEEVEDPPVSLTQGDNRAFTLRLPCRGYDGVMRAKDIALPAIVLGLAAGYAYTALPSSALQSGDQRARIERAACDTAPHRQPCRPARR